MKKAARYLIPCGKGAIACSVPRERVLGVVRPRRGARPEPRRLIARALGRLGGRASFDGKDILIVVSDLTRRAHVREIMPLLLKKIASGARRVDIIVGTGLHKPHTPAERALLLGGDVARRCNVIDHRLDRAALMDLGVTARGVPRILSRSLEGRDLVVTIGVIEPHLYAGYSGGAKTVAIGLAGEPTINATHGIAFLDDPSVRIGSVEGNAFQDALWQITRGVAPRWLAVNVVNDPDGNLAKVYCGEVEDVFRDGVRFAKRVFEAAVKAPADIALCGIGHPKDANLYQASRAVNYILNTARPIIRKGGLAIIVADLREGMGGGVAEKRFGRELGALADPDAFIAKTRRAGCVAGVHRAYMVARALAGHKIAFVSPGGTRLFRGLPIPCFSTIEKALAYADGVMGADAKIHVVPRSLCTVATIAA